MKRTVFALALAVLAIDVISACSQRVTLVARGGKCEYGEQCQQGLLCQCVRRRNPDDEGPDEIVAPGVCETADYSCGGDAGETDTAPSDTGAPDTGIIDTGTLEDAAVDGG